MTEFIFGSNLPDREVSLVMEERRKKQHEEVAVVQSAVVLPTVSAPDMDSVQMDHALDNILAIIATLPIAFVEKLNDKLTLIEAHLETARIELANK
jgi:hypothetical protein